MIQCTKNLKMKKEFKVIADLLSKNTRVLDVGCGDGSLMNFLEKEKNIEVRGLELNKDNVQKCINKGLTVIQGNAETELHQFPNKSFDFVVKTPPAAVQLLEAAKVKKGSGEHNRSKVASVTWEQVRNIAEDKMQDLNAFTVESAMKMVAGTARSMGLTVKGQAPF